MEKKFKYQIKEREVVITRKFEASHTKVWNSFTESKILDKWWAPKPWKCHTKEQEFKVAGRWLYYMQGPNGETHWSYLNYTSIDPQNYFTGIDGFCDEQGVPSKDQPSSEWRIEFTSDQDGCSVTSTCKFENEDILKSYLDMGFLEGYEMGLNNLEEFLKN